MKASWITTVFGALVILLTWAQQVFVEQGFPSTGKEWLSFLALNATGLIGVFSKAWNVTNSGTNAPAHVVDAPK